MKVFCKVGAVTLALFLVLGNLQAQTVDAIIDQYINALGGKQKLKALRSIKLEGELQNQGLPLELITRIVHGVGLRVDIRVPNAGNGYQIITPTKGWSFMPFDGSEKPRELSDAERSASQAGIDLQGALFNYKQKGNKVELVGKEMVDSLNCFKLKIMFKSGEVKYYYIDDQQYRRVKLLATEIINGVPTESITLYSDFRRTPQGYLFPYTQVSRTGTLQLKGVTVNPAIQASIFKPE